MGFGNGYNSARIKRGGKSYNNSMTAHVWNAQSVDAGQSGNGNLYFVRRTLYSYGSHFVVGYIMPDGVAFLNADSYSVSTSQHQADARGATKDRRTVHVRDLTELAGDRKLLPRIAEYLTDGANAADRKAIQVYARAALVEHASALTAEIYRPGAERYSWDSETNRSTRVAGEMEAGAYLAGLVGLSRSWPAIKRERARLDAAAKRKEEAKESERAKRMAIYLADMSDKDWREKTAMSHSNYLHKYKQLSKDLFHAQRYAKAHGFSAKRRANLKARRADALRYVNGYQVLNSLWRGRESVRRYIKRLRAVERLEAEREAGAEVSIVTREAAARQAIEALRILARYLCFPAATRDRMNKRADGVQSFILPSLQVKLAEYRKAEREREEAERAERARLASLKREEQIAAWYEGADVRISFDAETGGAAMRVKGDILETSHGASVPLAHAIKAFRFVKLCRARGEAWERNGRTVRVGHFQIDRIDANGDFKAGCHRFTWPEIERVAAAIGVADAEPCDAREPSSHAA